MGFPMSKEGPLLARKASKEGVALAKKARWSSVNDVKHHDRRHVWQLVTTWCTIGGPSPAMCNKGCVWFGQECHVSKHLLEFTETLFECHHILTLPFDWLTSKTHEEMKVQMEHLHDRVGHTTFKHSLFVKSILPSVTLNDNINFLIGSILLHCSDLLRSLCLDVILTYFCCVFWCSSQDSLRL